jgi:hypothetical protein
VPSVEFLWWRGCPSWEQALDELRAEVDAQGLDPDAIRVSEVSSEVTAEAEHFVGSPTIRINGSDVQPPGDSPAGLTCRVYRLRDGRISAIPDRADIAEALEREIGRSQT